MGEEVQCTSRGKNMHKKNVDCATGKGWGRGGFRKALSKIATGCSTNQEKKKQKETLHTFATKKNKKKAIANPISNF